MKNYVHSIALLILGCCLLGCSATTVVSEKINGVSFVASRDTLQQKHIIPLLEIHADYAAIMPFGFVRDKNHPELHFNSERQWFGERYEGVKQYIELLRENEIKVMLKPHIWIWRGVFTGDMKMDSEADWVLFENSYEEFILLYAQLAEETHADLLCIGTELFNFVDQRPDFWKQLIKKVRATYTGKITYAENWDKVDRVAIWEDLDFIGADAYFPVSEAQTPTIEDALAGWKPHKKLLASLSKQYSKPVLFTEFGYRSADYAGKEPWASDRYEGKMNSEAQAQLYEALFKSFWDEPWFAGGFAWKWFHNHDRAIQQENNRFTPQGKQAEEVLKKWYQNSVN